MRYFDQDFYSVTNELWLINPTPNYTIRNSVYGDHVYNVEFLTLYSTVGVTLYCVFLCSSSFQSGAAQSGTSVVNSQSGPCGDNEASMMCSW